MTDVTRILHQIETGEPSAAEQLVPQLYDKLRRVAQTMLKEKRIDHTLTPTALVHEAYLRIAKTDQALEGSSSAARYFSIAARSMRRVLVDSA